MGNVYIFRGKAASGKTMLSNMLAGRLSIPVFRKDDIVDALKMTDEDKELINNTVCYNILCKMIQTNLDLKVDFIIDSVSPDINNAENFLRRFDFKDYAIYRFFIDCGDEAEWRRRHEARIKNPLPHEVFKSFEHVAEHYKKFDIRPSSGECVIDTAEPVEKSFQKISETLNL